MDKFIISVELRSGKSYRMAVPADEAVARGAAESALWRHAACSVGLLRNGLLIDVFDGEWMTDVEDRYWRSMADECMVAS